MKVNFTNINNTNFLRFLILHKKDTRFIYRMSFILEIYLFLRSGLIGLLSISVLTINTSAKAC